LNHGHKIKINLWRKKERLSLKKHFGVEIGMGYRIIYTFARQQTLNFSNHE